MIKCIVIDDEKPARDEISYLIDQHESFQVLSSFDSGKSFLENIGQESAEVLFVDINMPVMTGIELVEHLRALSIDIRVVFVTAYDDYAVKAFELHAVDYILKPISKERIMTSLDHIEVDIQEHSYDDKLDKLMSHMNKDKIEHLCFHKDGKITPIKIKEIIFVKAENKGTLVQTSKGTFISSIQLRELEKKLIEHDFFRCHRSYLINLNYILHIEPWFNRTYQVDLEGIEEKIPISRNYVQHFKDMMNIL